MVHDYDIIISQHHSNKHNVQYGPFDISVSSDVCLLMVKMFSQGSPHQRHKRSHLLMSHLNGPDTFYREAGGCTRETHRGFDQLIKAQIEANSSWWGAGWTVRWFALLIQEHAAVSLLRILKGDTLRKLLPVLTVKKSIKMVKLQQVWGQKKIKITFT